jgi:hypothetical protein
LICVVQEKRNKRGKSDNDRKWLDINMLTPFNI